MITKLLQEIEELIGSDWFAMDMGEKMEEIVALGGGYELVEPILQIMERHPMDDFGMPGEMVHFIEKFSPEYEVLLVESLKRRPALHTVWMLNRCINGSADKESHIALLKEIAENDNIEQEIRESALDFYKFQTKA